MLGFFLFFWFILKVKNWTSNEWNEIFVNQQNDFSPVDSISFRLFSAGTRVSRATSLQDCCLPFIKEGKTYSQSPLSSGSFDFPLYKLPRACASLPLVVRFIFVWIPREKPRVNLAAFRVTVWVKRERREGRRNAREREKKSQEKVGGGIREEEKEKGRISPG